MTVSIYQQWIDAKAEEKAAQEKRRTLEDQMIASFNVPETLDGTENFEADGYKIKVVGRMNRKVDSDRVQEIAAENGTSEHLSALFRWKPEINMAVWKATDKTITDPLLAAITTTPGRPSFTIEQE